MTDHNSTPHKAGQAAILPPERSETDVIRLEITDAKIMAGIRALGEWQEKKDYGQSVTKSDLVCAIYASMRRT